MISLNHEFDTDSLASSNAASPLQATSLGPNTPRIAKGNSCEPESDSDSRVLDQRVAERTRALTPLEQELRTIAIIGRERGLLRDMTKAEIKVRTAVPADKRDPIWISHDGHLSELITERSPESIQVRTRKARNSQ